jgi:hypothetical protein
LAEEFSSSVAVKVVSFTWILSFTGASVWADELADDFGV